MNSIQRFYRKIREDLEYCFYVETSAPLESNETQILAWLLAETFEQEQLSRVSFLASGNVVELGPRLSFETAFSTNAVSICRACGLEKVTRLEQSRRYVPPSDADRDEAIGPAAGTPLESSVRPPWDPIPTSANHAAAGRPREDPQLSLVSPSRDLWPLDARGDTPRVRGVWSRRVRADGVAPSERQPVHLRG